MSTPSLRAGRRGHPLRTLGRTEGARRWSRPCAFGLERRLSATHARKKEAGVSAKTQSALASDEAQVSVPPAASRLHFFGIAVVCAVPASSSEVLERSGPRTPSTCHARPPETMSSVAVILGAGPGFGTSRVEHRCTDYDIDRPAGAMRADGSPEVDQLLSESLVMPRDP